jgi:hypothetical protein
MASLYVANMSHYFMRAAPVIFANRIATPAGSNPVQRIGIYRLFWPMASGFWQCMMIVHPRSCMMIELSPVMHDDRASPVMHDDRASPVMHDDRAFPGHA